MSVGVVVHHLSALQLLSFLLVRVLVTAQSLRVGELSATVLTLKLSSLVGGVGVGGGGGGGG